MYRKMLAIFLLVLMVAFWEIALQQTCAEETKETITLVTYYPAPYGVYKNLEAKKSLAVGDITQSADFNSLEEVAEGRLWLGKGAIFNPRPGDDPNADAANPTDPWYGGTAGELAYAQNVGPDGTFYFHNGSEWVAQGGVALITLHGG